MFLEILGAMLVKTAWAWVPTLVVFTLAYIDERNLRRSK